MKYKLTLILLIIHFQLSARNKNDSTFRFSLVLGANYYLFNNIVVSTDFRTSFFHSVIDYDNYVFGIKANKRITGKKDIGFTLNYSHSNFGYTYSYYTFSRQEIYGKIKMNGLAINTVIQYKALKWLKVNYGFSHYINLTNKFDNNDLAKEVSWYNEDNKSRLKSYTFALCAGAEFKIYKRLSLEANIMRGQNKFITLKLLNDINDYEFPQKLRYTGLTLNYKIR